MYVPVSAGGLAFMYNLIDNSGNRMTNLQLTRRTACKIFTGAITTLERPGDRGDQPAARRLQPRHHPGDPRRRRRGELRVLAVLHRGRARRSGRPSSQDRISHDPANVAQRLPGRVSRCRTGPQNWGRSLPVAVRATGRPTTVADPVAGKDTITYVAAGYAKVRELPDRVASRTPRACSPNPTRRT